MDPDAAEMAAFWGILEYQTHGNDYEGQKHFRFAGMQTNKRIWSEIIHAPAHMQVDHINHDHCDNRRRNLRVCTGAQNKQNTRLYKNNKTGVKGVVKNRDGKYMANIRIDKKLVHLGTYHSIEAAKQARLARARIAFGDFCNE